MLKKWFAAKSLLAYYLISLSNSAHTICAMNISESCKLDQRMCTIIFLCDWTFNFLSTKIFRNNVKICQPRLVRNMCLWRCFCNTDIMCLITYFVAVSKWNVQWLALKLAFNIWPWPRFYYIGSGMCCSGSKFKCRGSVAKRIIHVEKITFLLHQTQP